MEVVSSFQAGVCVIVFDIWGIFLLFLVLLSIISVLLFIFGLLICYSGRGDLFSDLSFPSRACDLSY